MKTPARFALSMGTFLLGAWLFVFGVQTAQTQVLPGWPAGFMAASNIPCTGGTITTSGGQTIHTFTSNANLVCSQAKTITALVIGPGGSGGGGWFGGGGGAGGMCELPSTSLAAGTYAVVIGTGGAAVTGNGVIGNQGSADTTFNGITAVKGGAGGAYDTVAAVGSAAGGAANAGTGKASTQTTPSGGATCYGNTGGTGTGTAGAGGGGAGGAGGGGAGNPGARGAGRANSISGASVTYSTGGRGGNNAGGSAACSQSGDGGDAASSTGGTSRAGCDGKVVVSYAS
jgi:hypothetical protein